MVFSSIAFLYMFLPLVLLVYGAAPRKWKNPVLLVASLVFYAWGEPVYIFLMLFSAVVDYTLGLLVDGHRGSPRARYFVALSAVVNLGLLGFFKYAPYIAGLLESAGGPRLRCAQVALPIGISFYTFQTMSYTIDVYRGDAQVQKSLVNLATYVTLFPQLIAGPIVRYNTIAEGLDGRRESLNLFGYGVRRFTVGLGKKVLLANNIGMLFDELKSLPQGQISTVGAWLGTAAFAFQIYFDFSGYSDMAIGLGSMFGFHFEENFKYPFISQSVTEFWRRWHISLGTWFRDYVFIPCGGSRQGLVKTCRNLALVWFLTGIWHGASMNFALWGLYFALLLIAEKVWLFGALKQLPRVFRHAYLLLATGFSWVLFAFEDLGSVKDWWGSMCGLGHGPFATPLDRYLWSSYRVLLLVLALASTPVPKVAARWVSVRVGDTWGRVVVPVAVACVLTLSTAYLVDASYNPFLYFRF